MDGNQIDEVAQDLELICGQLPDSLVCNLGQIPGDLALRYEHLQEICFLAGMTESVLIYEQPASLDELKNNKWLQSYRDNLDKYDYELIVDDMWKSYRHAWIKKGVYVDQDGVMVNFAHCVEPTKGQWFNRFRDAIDELTLDVCDYLDAQRCRDIPPKNIVKL